MLVMLGALFTGSLSAWADSGNPFGFETKTHPQEYEYCKKEPGLFRDHGYKCSSAPRPHPDLEEYALQFVEDVGLCSITALSNAFLQGYTADAKFEMFKDQISKKYGPPTSKAVTTNEPVNHWSPKAGFGGLGDVKEIEIKLKTLTSSRVENYDDYATLRDAKKKIDAAIRAGATLRPEIQQYYEQIIEGMKELKTHHKVQIIFRLVTLDTCRKKIDDNAYRAF